MTTTSHLGLALALSVLAPATTAAEKPRFVDVTEEAGLAGLAADQVGAMVIAYEPIWAIGTGQTATPDQAQEAHAFIRGCLERAFSAEAAAAIRILYGGSLKPGNAHELLSKADVDGGLIGGASLDVDSFSGIIRAAADCAAGE